MKLRNCILLLGFASFIFGAAQLSAQDSNAKEIFYQHEMQRWNELAERSVNHINDTTIDVHFYHLDIEVTIDSAYIAGSVEVMFEPKVDGLNELFLDLYHSLQVDSISAPCQSFSQSGDKIWITLVETFDAGEQISLTVYYRGKPTKIGNTKGLVYETHNGSEPIIASLSTPYLAHSWYPCKDGPEDKADSVFTDITIKDSIINGRQLIAVSNGVMESMEKSENKNTFKWRHRYPIVSYYVMVAISNYDSISDFYNGSGVSFPLDYYFFQEAYQSTVDGVADIPDAIGFFNEKFGPYPFHQEKFGMTQLGFYGAIENQTNVIQNTLNDGWFLVTVHELAHMWFADMITCETWNHGWLNEGFATYSEALWMEHQHGLQVYQAYMLNMAYWGGGTLYLEDTSDPFGVFVPIIYRKGAWALHMLRNAVGDEVFFKAIKAYALNQDFRFGHANTGDLQNVFEEEAQTDLDYFFDQWIYDEYFPIYNYNFKQNGNQLDLLIVQSQGDSGHREVFEMPIDVKISFSDATDTTLTVFNDQKEQGFQFEVDKEVVWVYIDPDNWILGYKIFADQLPVNTPQYVTENFKVYPNPTKDLLFIESQFFGGSLTCEIYDLSGRKRFERRLKSSKESLDISELNDGLFFYRMIEDNKRILKTGKLIKQ